jgi:hypothetical protein
MGSALTRHRVTIRQHTRLSPLSLPYAQCYFLHGAISPRGLAFPCDSNNDKITPFAFPRGFYPDIALSFGMYINHSMYMRIWT